MTTPPPPGLELPVMLHGLSGVVDRKVEAANKMWTREYLQTGAFTQPRRMRSVAPDELLVMNSGVVFDAWCPGGPASVREQLALTVERIACATRQDCEEAVLRVIPVVVELGKHLKHRELLTDPVFLRERLVALSPKDFEMVSSASVYAVAGQVNAWDRELERQ